MPSSLLSSDSMHLGLLAAAAHASATNSRFTIFYNPRAIPSEFVIPLAKYVKAVYHTRIFVGMRFRMMFETKESSVHWYMGTITGICDLDPARWANSHWQSVKVGWDMYCSEDQTSKLLHVADEKFNFENLARSIILNHHLYSSEQDDIAEFSCPSYFALDAKSLINRILDPNLEIRTSIAEIIDDELFIM